MEIEETDYTALNLPIKIANYLALGRLRIVEIPLTCHWCNKKALAHYGGVPNTYSTMKTSLKLRSLIFASLFTLATISACTTNETDSIILQDTADLSCADSKANDPDFDGTACCIQRNSELSASAPIVYEYFTNLPNPDVSWEVVSGDIEIVSGANSSTVTIRLGSSFTGGEISGGATSDDNGFDLVCRDVVVISADLAE